VVRAHAQVLRGSQKVGGRRIGWLTRHDCRRIKSQKQSSTFHLEGERLAWTAILPWCRVVQGDLSSLSSQRP
jgi:hypothetical protein